MPKKKAISFFSILTIVLMVLPFLVALNEGLTRVVELTPIYNLVQNYIVPYEVKIVSSFLYAVKFPVQYQQNGIIINNVFLEVTWNCLGWQSLLFICLSFIFGFDRKYTRSSILMAIMIGIMGTFLINISRMIVIIILGGYFPSLFMIFFHNYLAAEISIVWLVFFWWFSYSFVLEDKSVKV